MDALRKHYSGEGKTSRRIAVAERIRDTLHYKNERAMSFSAFLDKMQKMFNIFEEEDEVISEQAKVPKCVCSSRRLSIPNFKMPSVLCAYVHLSTD